MNKYEFHEVDGCTHFVPVRINKTNSCGVDVTVVGKTSQTRTVVNQVYKFNKHNEPQKPMIPKFVAEWIKYCKDRRSTLYFALAPTRMSKELNEWMALGNNDDIFSRAWLDGYEVEKEPLYQIFMKNTKNHKNQIQQLVKQGDKWFFCGNDVHRFKTKFTKGQIEAAGFGWVFDCDGVKVVEVE